EVVGVPYSGALDGEDAVPPDARVDQLGASATARGRGDTVALAQRGERPPALRRQQRMLGGGDDAPSAQRRQAIDAATTAGGGAQHPAPSQPPALVARQGGLDALDTMDDVLDPHPPSAIGVEHAGVAHDALRKAVERERRDLVDDLVGGPTGDPTARHALAQLHLDLRHPPLAPLEPERAPKLLRLAAAE